MIRSTSRWRKPALANYSACADDAIVFYTDRNDRFIFLSAEFDAIMYGHFELLGEFTYTQVLGEWNECKGYDGLKECPSEILDTSNLTMVLTRILKRQTDDSGFLPNLEHNNDFNCPETDDLSNFVAFLNLVLKQKSKLFITKSSRWSENRLSASSQS